MTDLFSRAAGNLRAAALATASPAAPALLNTAAHEIAQGVPSLRLTADPARRELAIALEQAADGARSLARATEHLLWLGQQDPVDHHFGYAKQLAVVNASRSDVGRWAGLADAASAILAV